MDNCEYGSCHLDKFSDFYSPIHKPLSYVICIFGTVANTVNIVVLSQKGIRTPTNVLLTGLSLAQLMLVANYIALQSFLMCRDACCSGVWNFSGAWYMYLNVNFNLVFHTVAFTHTVILSIFRFMSIQWPVAARAIIHSQRPWRWSLLIFLIVPFLCIPVYLTATIGHVGKNYSGCIDDSYDLQFVNDPILLSAVFWLFGIAFKLIPCSLLAVFSGLLINSIRQANLRKQRLLDPNYRIDRPSVTNGSVALTTATSSGRAEPRGRASGGTVDEPRRRASGVTVVRSRTTRMLIAVACCCFVVEFTHGILNLLTAVYGSDFGEKIYNQLGDLFEMLTLLYSSINFVLYCVMSTDFLRAFARLFCPQIVHRAVVRRTTRRKNASASNPRTKKLSDLTQFRQMKQKPVDGTDRNHLCAELTEFCREGSSIWNEPDVNCTVAEQ